MPDGHPASGGLTPEDAAIETLHIGMHHLCETVELAFLKNVYGGLLLSAGGLLALVLATGFPDFDSSPGLSRLLQGTAFPVGLIVVYFLGAELYTGYPMWLAMTALDRKGFAFEYFRSTLVALAGNFVGAVWWAGMQSYFTETLTEEPWRSRIIEQVDSDITDNKWHVIFLRALGCGFLVTIAMLLGTQNRDGISKALGLHLPFVISTVAKFPHTVEYMYLGTTGMMLGARLTMGQFFWKCMLPIILGNSVGGAFTGAYNYWVFIRRADDKERTNNRNWLSDDAE
ncbi:Formate/nitrite transporter [Hortaea werneckii]|uniref:Formate/nitrite transporter n=1 Tax=Hortaea werneckii TaxID=91943 RepID=A0A3M7EZT0_HORWE|nr:Formate/nitrite transporter [Hortaea werneckii]KAI6998632.1 Formate/nitrite transporter [Hortaea werneckii]KAI7146893.1 Formate/nitrite transporter [Hortaea werneckii]KAI7179079.1 Formate/nitrite transporter [Hortaea werneckii]KAI7190036.1 Formate/nitrite transporter [Hortaea werneckii]